MLKDGNIGEKPRSSISDLIDILCLERYEEDSYEGLAELVESINLQPHTGCVGVFSCWCPLSSGQAADGQRNANGNSLSLSCRPAEASRAIRKKVRLAEDRVSL